MAGLQQDGECNNCGSIKPQVCCGIGIATTVAPSSGWLEYKGFEQRLLFTGAVKLPKTSRGTRYQRS